MTWLIIIVVLLVAFGPVLWLVPSKKDRRLAALRARGRAEGFVVEIRRIPKLNPDPRERVTAGGRVLEPVLELAAYGLALSRRMDFLPAFRVLRAADSTAADPFPGWSYDRRPKSREHLTPLLEILQPMLAELPEDVMALEIERRMLIVYWLEKPGSAVETVTEMAGKLRDFDASIGVLEDRIRAALDEDDS